MLATLARIAGRQRIVLYSPPPIAKGTLRTTELYGTIEIFQLWRISGGRARA